MSLPDDGKTSSIAVETSRSTTLSDSIVRQTNKRSSYLSYNTMNSKHIFNDSKILGQKISTKTEKQTEIFYGRFNTIKAQKVIE